MSKIIAQPTIQIRFESKSSEERTESALKSLIEKYQSPTGIDDLSDDEKTEIYNELFKLFYRDIVNNKEKIIVSEGITLFDPKEHYEWDSDNLKYYYWRHLKYFLNKQLLEKHDTRKAAEIFESLDKETSAILNNLEDPRRDEFTSKGLVIGYVQSGKTQNFTGLIAKCADAGYRFIIVMAGMYNSLRLQTQIRIDKELTGYNTLNLDEAFVEWADAGMRWEPLTSAGTVNDTKAGEFGNNNKSFNDIFRHNGPPVIAVVKKNVSVLKKLETWINQGNGDIRNNIPLLLIDDEADQASIDTKKDDNTDPSAINKGIRAILEHFKKHAYIGYTATPFANVLIGRDKVHPELENDLYPRNFIHTLPEPEGYFGTFKIFGEDFSPSFYDNVSPDEKDSIIIDKELPAMLDKSILTFLVSIIIRKSRGDENAPMSMLIHVDHKKNGHANCLEVVSERIDNLKTLLATRNFRRQFLLEQIEYVFEELIENARNIQTHLNLDYSFPDYKFIKDEIELILSEIQIYKLNSDSEDELDYFNNPELKVIAIGGNQLSRGLTLEGLMTTYFMRDSKQYDTLLQMGRWFGYRNGFEDLLRIYTPERIIDSFTHLALVEQELRENLTVYKREQVTPAEIAPIIRDHSRLNVTARNKMQSAQKIRYYGSTIEQTIWLPLDDHEKLRHNVDIAEKLLDDISDRHEFLPKESSYLASGISVGLVGEFLSNYQKPDEQYIGTKGIDIEDILRYIQRHDLNTWNICVASSSRTTFEEIRFGSSLHIIPFERSRKVSRFLGAYNLGVLSSKNHFRIDLNSSSKSAFDDRRYPLLVLYRISQDSTKGDNRNREDLFEGLEKPGFDPMGFAIVFPQSKMGKDEYDYIGQIFE